jgi:hypothetical protein
MCLFGFGFMDPHSHLKMTMNESYSGTRASSKLKQEEELKLDLGLCELQ